MDQRLEIYLNIDRSQCEHELQAGDIYLNMDQRLKIST
jgi:hypothetical protein